MFTDLLNRLFASNTKKLPELDAQHAIAGLLVRTAKTDGNYAVQEIRRIDRILAAAYGLNPVEAAKLRAGSERLEAQAPEDGRFAAAIRDRLDIAHREAVLVSMWRVALSDGDEKSVENAYLNRAAERLGLDQAAVERARKSAEQSAPLDE